MAAKVPTYHIFSEYHSLSFIFNVDRHTQIPKRINESKVKKLVKCKIYIKQKMVQSWSKLILNSQQPIRSIIWNMEGVLLLFDFSYLTFSNQQMLIFIIIIRQDSIY